VGSVLGELSSLARDLLLRKTAPQGGAALLTGGYDEATMRGLGKELSAQRLLWMLTILQRTAADLARSGNRRTDAELCLIRLCGEELDESLAGLSARVARLEERMAQGAIVQAAPAERQTAPAEPPPAPAKEKTVPSGEKLTPEEDAPPWEEGPPLPEEAPPEEADYVFDDPEPEPPAPKGPAEPPKDGPRPALAAPSASAAGDRAFWPSFAAGLRGKVSPSVYPYLNNPNKVAGVWKNGLLTLWVDSEFTRSMLNKPPVLEGLKKAAAAAFGGEPQVSVVTGKPPEEPMEGPPVQKDALDELTAFGKFDNITIQ